MKKCGFAAGCFWGVEHAFKQVEGVISTTVGFQGGNSTDPSYREVCDQNTNHAEVVQVTYDESIVTLKRLLDAFFFMHDPTQLNKQGPDIGTQYRSALFPTDEVQKKEMLTYLEELKGKYSSPVVTTIEEGIFFSAEEMHQDYLANNPTGYCHIGLDTFAKLKQGLF